MKLGNILFERDVKLCVCEILLIYYRFVVVVAKCLGCYFHSKLSSYWTFNYSVIADGDSWNILMIIETVCITSFDYTVWVRKVDPKNFLWYFQLWWTCLTENYLAYWPNIFLCLHQSWSICLNICMNCITFTSKLSQILTIWFSLLQNS